jgi:hypothetical protein
MEMSALRKSDVKPLQLILSVCMLGTVLQASSEIILQAGGEASIIQLSNYSVPMSGIVIFSPVPSASTSPQVARNLQRAHGWSAYKDRNAATGGPLVFGGTGAVAVDRQGVARANVSRAQAFRQDYYK